MVDVVPVASVRRLDLASGVNELGPVVHQWLPPCMLMLSGNESNIMRITAVDSAFQI